MKTPEKIKKVLECIVAQFDGRCEDHVACVCCPLFVEDVGVEDVVAYFERLEAQVAKDINVPAWISVEERLPEDDVNVLVYAIGNNEPSVIAMTSYTHNMYGFNVEGWRAPWQYFFHEYKITHWMPLPEPPKEA